MIVGIWLLINLSTCFLSLVKKLLVKWRFNLPSKSMVISSIFTFLFHTQQIIGFRFWWWWFYWSHRHRKRRQIIDSKWIESRRNRIGLGKSLGWRWHRWRQTPFRQWVFSRHYKKSRFHGDISLRYLSNKATPKSTDFLLKILLCVSVNLSVFQRVLRCKSKFFWQIFWLLE